MTTLFKTLSAIKRSVTDNNEDIFWLTKSREWATENDLKNHSRNYIRTNIGFMFYNRKSYYFIINDNETVLNDFQPPEGDHMERVDQHLYKFYKAHPDNQPHAFELTKFMAIL
ncbi:MAG: hypothetical protein KAS32_14325 [Candidatus Peribacteraceae bacterium]|nr:hypothetical protein [Candidatus Peribacteraceae bacterium]